MSCDSASTIEYNMMSFLVSDKPLDVMLFVFPAASVREIIGA
jgi:hypothetical protein